MGYKATLEVPFRDSKLAKNAYDSLIQEPEFTKKSSTKINVRGSSLVVSIVAGDFASFRATINSYTRLLAVFFGAKEVVES